jgi:hypothetical protein
MIGEVAKVDPTILEELREPVAIKGNKAPEKDQVRQQKQEFDASLGDRRSELVSATEGIRETLVSAVRNVLGRSSEELADDDTLRRLMDPGENPFLADIYDTGMLDPLTRSLRQVSLTFKTRLSHTADSQRQRHRRTPGATPPIEATYDGSADYVVPMIIEENEELRIRYDQVMEQIYGNVEQAIRSGIPLESALLLLPNAHAFRVVEQGDLFDWQHRWKQRLCYLAQEEIFFISVEQVEQLAEELPESENMLLAPCGIRQKTGVKPRCPEGERWCGKPVYNWGLGEYEGQRLA